MKRIVIAVYLLALSVPCHMRGAGITVDPALTAAVIAQTAMLKSEYEKRSKHHAAIEVAQAAVTVAMDNIHMVEETILNYMGNASGVMQNMYQLKKIVELSTVDIPSNLSNLASDIPDNLKGAAITLFVNNTITDTTADIVALSSIVDKLVTSKYSFKDSKDKNDKNINLLSAAERYTIMQDVVRRLMDINRRIYLTNFYIKSFSWKQLWMGLDRESWCNVMYGEIVAKSLIRKWNEFKI
ncbi:hypothetical protein [Bacteroides acidifaciens]|uniref:hypothetical protein n=1 Tax=Bacteroides acidifaciens TaxID=85831 RepID=UPI003013395A